MNANFSRSLYCVLIGLFIAGVVLQLSGYNPTEAFSALWSGATGLKPGLPKGSNDIALGTGKAAFYLNKYHLAQSLARATPLLLIGLSVALSLQAGLFNIGAQGQMMFGALSATVVGGMKDISPTIHIPLTILAGIIGGAFWGAIPGILKAYRGVHEVIATILLNYMALHITAYLVMHSLRDPNPKKMAAQTAMMSPTSWLSPLVPGSNLTSGLFVALFLVICYVFLLNKMALGFEIRAVGSGQDAARAAGIPVEKTIITTMAIAGGLAGVAGALEVMGVQHLYRADIVGNYGFDGITVALLGNMAGFGVTLSALFFGMLSYGAGYMESQTRVPNSIAVMVQGLVILFIGIRYVSSKAKNSVLEMIDDEIQEE